MKKSFLTRLICCWLAFVVLLSSTGFGMVEHWCQMRGHSKSLLLNQKGCAKPCQADELSVPVSGNPVVKKMPCCKTTISYEHLDVSRFVTESPVVLQPAEFIPNPRFRLLLAAMLPAEVASSTLPLAHDPVFRSGRHRLIAGCTWLI